MAAPTLAETDAPAVRAERFALVRSAWPLALILLVSALLHFVFFSRPLQVVFDEVYFARFGLAYLDNRYYFDLHPPLGKLIFFVTGWLAGLSSDFSFAKNMLPFPDASYLVLRVPPRLAGTLLP
ncbi:MAG TPA: phospholipid carrier-dependent glycosyltransferase, partial [Burkholderiaceae bacterium]|nr:phospholipid carrier-dependent glycosyltransferase [Burkholderiaceae bacterium]